MTHTPADYLASNAWPFTEARRVIEHLETKAKRAGYKDKGFVLFETGYGPSGLPHIGTFGEVFRTTMVQHAFQKLMPGTPTKLICFSDDMDGLRKVPENVPNKQLLIPNLHKPLTRVPDPFEKYESFAHHNNAMLQRFLDGFNFQYEFKSSTEVYTSGQFNEALLNVLKHHQQIVDIIIPTLGEERAATYSPFLPVCEETGHVLQVPVIATNVAEGTLTYRRADGKEVTTKVTDGACKLQWKADWAMRWVALDVDYEMSGKDLIDSVTLGSKIALELGGLPPVSLTYEHFVDENGAKISKSKGNGLSIEEWLNYAPADSLSLFMYRAPSRAKKLFRGMIPQTVDEYTDLLDKYPTQTVPEQLENPAYHIHNGNVPANIYPCGYGMLLNIINTIKADSYLPVSDLLEKYGKAHGHALVLNHTQLQKWIEGGINFYRDTILPTQKYRIPTEEECAILQEIANYAAKLVRKEINDTGEEVQTYFYELGKRHYGKEKLRDWFKFLYETLLGSSQGPRLGTLMDIIGPEHFAIRVSEAMNRHFKQ